MKNNFEKYHAQLERYIFPALLGLANEADLKTIKKVEFIKTPEYIITYTIEQNDEQKIQSLSRQVRATGSYVWILSTWLECCHTRSLFPILKIFQSFLIEILRGGFFFKITF